MMIKKEYVIRTAIYIRETDSYVVVYYAEEKETGFPYFTRDVLSDEVKTFRDLKDVKKFVEQSYNKELNSFNNYNEYPIADNFTIEELTVETETAYTIHRDKIFG